MHEPGLSHEWSPTLYAEDLAVDVPLDLGERTVTHGEIVEFATHWDPQPFHIDDEFARSGFFGGVIASGIHSYGIFQRMAVLGAYRHWWMIAGRSIREIQLPSPVRPGMTLRGELTVTGVALEKPHRAIVSKVGTLKHGDQLVFSVTTDAWVHRRPDPAV